MSPGKISPARMPKRPESRDQLLALLADACELEHSLACCYLYSAFSLKQDLAEGLDWRRQQLVRRWASEIYFIASQEMLHLAQAWNLLTAIGGSPYSSRPGFPQAADLYPMHLPIVLERFGAPSLKRFALYERPSDRKPRELREMAEFGGLPGDSVFEYNGVAQLYLAIREAFETLPEQDLFVGDPCQQVSAETIGFPALNTVTGRQSALDAVAMISAQGEGTPTDHVDCHFGVFKRILGELAEAGDGLDPVRHVSSDAEQDDLTKAVSEAFDAVYVLMLRMLQHCFDTGSDLFARIAVELMVRVIKPVGEALCLVSEPGHDPHGPGFDITRHLALPRDDRTAQLIARERAVEISSDLQNISAAPGSPARLGSAASNLAELADRLAALDRP